MRRHVAAALLTLPLLLAGATASGQAPEDRAGGPPPRKGAPNIIRIKEEVIKGRVQKPEAFYILQRSNLNYRSLEPQKSFIPLIVETVKKEPF